MFLLFFLVAPVTFIILAYLRITDRLNMSIGNLTGYMMLLGCITVITAALIISLINEGQSPRCALPETAVLIGGIVASIAILYLIGFISWIIYYQTHKNSKNNK